MGLVSLHGFTIFYRYKKMWGISFCVYHSEKFICISLFLRNFMSGINTYLSSVLLLATLVRIDSLVTSNALLKSGSTSCLQLLSSSVALLLLRSIVIVVSSARVQSGPVRVFTTGHSTDLLLTASCVLSLLLLLLLTSLLRWIASLLLLLSHRLVLVSATAWRLLLLLNALGSQFLLDASTSSSSLLRGIASIVSASISTLESATYTF